MAGDYIAEGFGANPPFTQTIGTNSLIVRIISSQPGGLARIQRIMIAMLQTSGVFSATTYAPIIVIRGGASLGTGGVPGQLTVPFRPTGSVLAGLPDDADIKVFELLMATYIRVQNPVPLVDLNFVARNGQKLAVMLGQLVDASTNTPALLGSAGVLSVDGSVEPVDTSSQGSNGFSGARSLPRYAVGISEALGEGR
jgi:hypothetical protein